MTDRRIIREKLTAYVKVQLDNKAAGNTNPIFVFIGVEQYVNMDVFEKYIVDKSTFGQNGNKEFIKAVIKDERSYGLQMYLLL